jgi:hypothetical protein
MRKMTAWILGGVAALTVTGLAFAMPALAEDKAPNTDPTAPGYNMMQSGDMATMHNVMMPLMGQMPAMHQQVMGDVAKQLGMTLDELNQAMKDGKSLATLANEKGVAIGEIRATMTNGMKSFLDKLVADKTITQEQAGQMLGFMEKNMESCLTGQMGGGMMGGGMMGGGMMGGAAGGTGSQGCH